MLHSQHDAVLYIYIYMFSMTGTFVNIREWNTVSQYSRVLDYEFSSEGTASDHKGAGNENNCGTGITRPNSSTSTATITIVTASMVIAIAYIFTLLFYK